MNLLVPAALAFGAIIPIILLFYFMRPKRQERVVGSTLLWQQALQDIQASRPWQRLRVTPLLLLQLLAAVVIVLILTRPAIFIRSPISGNTIIILQASASMQATDVAPSRFESAKNTIADLIDAMGPDDHISLISMARTPQVLITQSQDKGQLHAALQRARITNQDANLEEALSLAGSLAAGESSPQVLVVGDGHVINTHQSIAVTFPVRYMSIGTDAPNAAILTLAARTLKGKLTAFAQIANFSHQTRALPIELYADNSLVGVQTITLAAGASGSLEWQSLKAGTRILQARLISQDAMTVDHEAWAIVGSALRGRTLLVTKGNLFLRTGLSLQPNVSLFETTPDKYSSASSTTGQTTPTTPATNYDLTVFDGFVPATLPTGNLLFVNPPAGNYLFGSSGKLTQVSQITAGNDTAHLLTDVDLSSIHAIHATHQLTAALWEQTIISSPETSLLLAGENENRRVAVLGFDLHDSDLPLQPSFPILLHNLTDWFLPSPVAEDAQVTPGSALTVQAWPGADRVTISTPDNHSSIVAPPFPVAPYTNTNSVGIYHVTQNVHGRTLDGTFAINLFNENQSKLAPAASLPVVNSTNTANNINSIPRQLREIWPWIAAFLLLVLCVEWWLFSRNYQASGTATRPRATPARLAQARQAASKATILTMVQDNFSSRLSTIKKQTRRMKKHMRGRFRKQVKGE